MRTWTGQEVRTLIRMYPDYPAKVVGHFLDRPEYSVYNMAQKLGLEKSQEFLSSPRAGLIQKGLAERGKPYRFDED